MALIPRNAILAALLCIGLTVPLSAADQPDVLIIIADDIGYSDFGCYGGEIETPNIDRLAAGGLRFTQYYTENMCHPTRASLLTGRYQIRGFSSPDNVTIPEALSAAGYRSCMSGKWHCTNDTPSPTRPMERGFDRFFGTPRGAGSFFAPLGLVRKGRPAEQEWQNDRDFYYTDAISRAAVQYIDESPTGTPLFLYVAYTAAHWPLHAKPEDIARYSGKYAMGWDRLREQRLQRMKEQGVIEPHVQLSPRHPDVPAWEDEPHQAWQQRRMEVYAAQIHRMDIDIGRILDKLESAGRLENTLVMLTIDNGACHVEYRPERTDKSLNKSTRDGRPLRVGNRPEIMPGPEDTWQSYGHGWANASNTPFRLFKRYDHQGGICVPLIVHWPRGIKQGGRITPQLAHVIDFLPTVLAAADVPYPETYQGRDISPADGKSLLPIFRDEERTGHDALFWSHASGRAVRQGRWKLVSRDQQPWELYDIEQDPTEVNNLVGTHPQKRDQLESLWLDWRASGKPSRDL